MLERYTGQLKPPPPYGDPVLELILPSPDPFNKEKPFYQGNELVPLVLVPLGLIPDQITGEEQEVVIRYAQRLGSLRFFYMSFPTLFDYEQELLERPTEKVERNFTEPLVTPADEAILRGYFIKAERLLAEYGQQDYQESSLASFADSIAHAYEQTQKRRIKPSRREEDREKRWDISGFASDIANVHLKLRKPVDERIAQEVAHGATVEHDEIVEQIYPDGEEQRFELRSFLPWNFAKAGFYLRELGLVTGDTKALMEDFGEKMASEYESCLQEFGPLLVPGLSMEGPYPIYGEARSGLMGRKRMKQAGVGLDSAYTGEDYDVSEYNQAQEQQVFESIHPGVSTAITVVRESVPWFENMSLKLLSQIYPSLRVELVFDADGTRRVAKVPFVKLSHFSSVFSREV